MKVGVFVTQQQTNIVLVKHPVQLLDLITYLLDLFDKINKLGLSCAKLSED